MQLNRLFILHNKGGDMKKCFDVIWVILILLGTVNTAFAEEKSILYNTSVTVVRTAHGNVWFVAKNGRGEKYNFWTTQTEKSNNMVFEAFTLRCLSTKLSHPLITRL